MILSSPLTKGSAQTAALVLVSSLTAWACSPADTSDVDGTGGGSGVSTGGTSSGGAVGVGGDGSTVGAGGADPGIGGAVGAGGSDPGSSGGNAASGGTDNSGVGGADTNAGGATGAGGEIGAGGTLGAGGELGAGGGVATTVLFSTDFESDAVGPVAKGGSPWTTTLPTEYDSGGKVEVTTSVAAHSGSKSVYVKKGNNGTGYLQMEGAPVFPFTAAKIHVRAYIRLSEWPESHAAWMEVGAVTNEENELRWGANEGVLQVNHWPGDQDQIADGVSLSVGEWHCIEYSYEPSTLTMEVYLEGAKVEALTVVGSFVRGGAFTTVPIDAVRFGAEINTTEAWFDDIAISDAFIGCL